MSENGKDTMATEMATTIAQQHANDVTSEIRRLGETAREEGRLAFEESEAFASKLVADIAMLERNVRRRLKNIHEARERMKVAQVEYDNANTDEGSKLGNARLEETASSEATPERSV